MRSIKEVLMTRDNISAEEADDLIEDAQNDLNHLLSIGDQEAAYEICADRFCLEPDYLMQLL